MKKLLVQGFVLGFLKIMTKLLQKELLSVFWTPLHNFFKNTHSKNSLAGVEELGLIWGAVTGLQSGVFHSLLQLVQGSTELMEASDAMR